jgi:cytochrome c oxidase subunit 3
MQDQQTFEQSLTRAELIALRNRRTGMNIFQISWILVFVCLVIVNFSLRGDQWPPEGVERLNVFLPTLATVGLIASGFTARRGQQTARYADVAGFRQAWLITLGLGALFVAAMGIEFFAVDLDNQYGAVFRVMTGFHVIHAVAISAYMYGVWRRLITVRANPGLTPDDLWSIEAGVKLWTFVVVAWLLFYVVLYWV